jgi:hypothetical protein
MYAKRPMLCGFEVFDAGCLLLWFSSRRYNRFSEENSRCEMRISWLRKLLSLFLVYSFSLLSLAQDQPATQGQGAVLHAAGRVEINGVTESATKALLPGDSVKTYDNSVANITTAGGSIMVMPNSLAKFTSTVMALSLGDVVIATSNGMAATSDVYTITPAAPGQSKFEIAEDDDYVTVGALEGNVTVSGGKENTTVQEGQQITLPRKKKKREGAAAAATGPALSHGQLAWLLIGAAGAGVLGLLIGTHGSGSSNCASPSGGKDCN